MFTPILDSGSSRPLYEQLYRYIRDEIEGGRLRAGERLPSKRALATHLKISVVTVEGAYGQLLAEGYRIPRDIAIASLYNSPTLNVLVPAVTTVDVSARMVGNMIGKQMIQLLQGKEYQKKTMIDYEILIRASTYRS